MQLKCTYCSTPFALSNDQVAEAIDILRRDPNGHYDAHCPRCRRANKLPRRTFALIPVYRRMLEEPGGSAPAAAELKPQTEHAEAEVSNPGKGEPEAVPGKGRARHRKKKPEPVAAKAPKAAAKKPKAKKQPVKK